MLKHRSGLPHLLPCAWGAARRAVAIRYFGPVAYIQFIIGDYQLASVAQRPVALPRANRNGSEACRNPTFHMHETLFGRPAGAGKSARLSCVVCGMSSPERER